MVRLLMCFSALSLFSETAAVVGCCATRVGLVDCSSNGEFKPMSVNSAILGA